MLFLNKILVIRAGIHKIHVGIANMEDPDQTARARGPSVSSKALCHCAPVVCICLFILIR